RGRAPDREPGRPPRARRARARAGRPLPVGGRDRRVRRRVRVGRMRVTGPRAAFDVTPVISGRTGIARYVTELGLALERAGVDVRRFAVGRRTYELPPGSRHIR